VTPVERSCKDGSGEIGEGTGEEAIPVVKDDCVRVEYVQSPDRGAVPGQRERVHGAKAVGDNLCSERGPGSVQFRADCGDVFAEADCVDARPSSVLEFVGLEFPCLVGGGAQEFEPVVGDGDEQAHGFGREQSAQSMRSRTRSPAISLRLTIRDAASANACAAVVEVIMRL
jgi:hypothetical protein